MSKAEIVEGIKMALARGESLEQAMMSFYNAGYLKEDIENAAREVQMATSRAQLDQPAQPQKTTFKQQLQAKSQIQPVTRSSNLKKPVSTQSKPLPQPKPIQQPIKQQVKTSQPVQAISKYDSGLGKKQVGKGLIITLISILGVLLVGLILLIIFREPVIEVFKSWFGV